MRQSVEARHQRILDVVSQHAELKVAHLAALTGVSMVTIRRDLEILTRRGAVERGHGMVRRPDRDQEDVQLDAGNQGTVALITPERHAYLNEVAQGARRYLEHAGFRVVLHLTPNIAAPESHLVHQLSLETIDGLLFAPRWRSAEDQREGALMLEKLRLPTLLVERPIPNAPTLPRIDSVCSDHRGGVQLAVDHLTALGHRRILLASRQDSPTARTVRQAFNEIAQAHSQITDSLTVLSSPEAMETDSSAGETGAGVSYEDPKWFPQLVRDRGFTAVLVHSDENALVLTQQMISAGIHVPDDVAVIAYDDVVAGLGTVPLTAVAPPKAEVGMEAAAIMCRRIRTNRSGEEWTPRRVELLPSLRVRSST